MHCVRGSELRTIWRNMTNKDMILVWSLYGLLAAILLTGVMLEYCFTREQLQKKGCEVVKYKNKT